jgi:hypothetical protein
MTRRKSMRRRRLPKPPRWIAGLLTSLLFAIFTLPLGAQTAPDSRATLQPGLGYDKAHEITLIGTIQEVVSKRIAGIPIGLHLLVASSRGMVDTHLGPFLEKDTQEALHTGTPVQIIGAMETIAGKDYLLARQVIFGGRLVTVRSENGFLVRAPNPRPARSKPESTTEKTSPLELNGGAR